MQCFARPTTAWITVNRQCNFRCPWCYAEETNYSVNDTMSAELAQRLVDIASEMGVKQVIFIGGEPTLWTSLQDLNSHCKKRGIRTCLVTNGFRFSQEWYWQQYLSSPCDEMNISVKTMSEANFATMTGASSRHLSDLAKSLDRISHSQLRASASIVYNNLMSRQELEFTAQEIAAAGIDTLTLSLCTATLHETGFSSKYMISQDRLVRDLMDVYPFLDELFDGKITLELSTMPLCIWPREFIDRLIAKAQIINSCHVQDRSGLVFDTNGNVLLCNSLFEQIIAKLDEDYSDSKSLLQFLNRPELCDTYEQLLRCPSDECSNCGLFNFCGGGCIANWTVLSPSICKAFTS